MLAVFSCPKERDNIEKYSIIYADPPWRYSAKKVQGAAENHYPTMSIEELCALPVAELAAKDSALFMWATFPQLPEALRLIRAWGFTYKSVAFVWLKKNKKADSWFYGLGFWTRANAEICLLATKGHPKRQAADIHQFIISPIEAHSKKPDETRDKIVALMGDLPRVELFARQTSPGWDVWGNEVESRPIPDFGTNCPKAGGDRRSVMPYVNVPNDLIQNQDENRLQPHQAAAHLFWRRGGGGYPVLPAGPAGSIGNTGATVRLCWPIMLPAFLLAMYET